MSYSDRTYRHRNPRGKEEKGARTPFFHAPKNGVNRKKKETIQRLATSKEDEKLATNDARMEKDKEEPLKPVQKKEAPKKEKEKPVQKAAKPKKDKEEKPVQKKARSVKEEEKPVQKKEKETTSARVAEAIREQTGKGRPLPPKLLAEMSRSLGADLGGVCIHTDVAAAKLCQELNALAFTHGRDVFFDTGRYNPESPEGRKLLIHELTHVIQQQSNNEE